MARCVETDRVVCSDKTVVTVAMSYQMAMGSDQMESLGEFLVTWGWAEVPDGLLVVRCLDRGQIFDFVTLDFSIIQDKKRVSSV